MSIIDIKNTLVQLEAKYNDPETPPDMQILYSKIALLEFCGWIESSFDSIVKTYISRHNLRKDVKELADDYIDRTYGFDYNKHVSRLFCSVLGVCNWSVLLDKIDQGGKLLILKSTLNSFYGKRNTAAHTNVTGTTKTFDSPSIVINNYNNVKTIMENIDGISSGL